MSDFIRHSIHCHGYRGCDVGFDDDECTCGATLKYCQEEIERLRIENHHLRGLLETAVDAHDCNGSVTKAWWEAARAAGGDDDSVA